VTLIHKTCSCVLGFVQKTLQDRSRRTPFVKIIKTCPPSSNIMRGEEGPPPSLWGLAGCLSALRSAPNQVSNPGIHLPGSMAPPPSMLWPVKRLTCESVATTLRRLPPSPGVGGCHWLPAGGVGGTR
jgi:hypothetical protein